MRSQNLTNNNPCKGFVKKSANISAVGHIFKSSYFPAIQSIKCIIVHINVPCSLTARAFAMFF